MREAYTGPVTCQLLQAYETHVSSSSYDTHVSHMTHMYPPPHMTHVSSSSYDTHESKVAGVLLEKEGGEKTCVNFLI